MDVTQLLRRIDAGDEAAREALLPLVQGELHRLAAAQMSRQRPDHTLQPTALVNEAWLKLGGAGDAGPFHGREHFLRTAARAMRQVLIDHARGRSRDKRAGFERQLAGPSGADALAAAEPGGDLAAVDEALGALERIDPELAQVVELRFFGGYAMEEVAALAGVSLSTAERRWRLARSWLRRALGDTE